MNLAKNIKHIREIKQYTQEYMASELGISQSNYQKLESGQLQLTPERLAIIAKTLQVSSEFIEQFNPDSIFVNQAIETNHGNSNGYIANYNNYMNEELMVQYEARIQEQKERIAELKEIIEFLKS